MTGYDVGFSMGSVGVNGMHATLLRRYWKAGSRVVQSVAWMAGHGCELTAYDEH
jgi:hypothetical protein